MKTGRGRVTIDDCRLIEFPKFSFRAGNISIYENKWKAPFEVKRVFYLYDIPAGESRGAHSHKECHQLIIAASGSFEVQVDDGLKKKSVSLNRPFYGLHIPPGIWAHEENFSAGAICLVLTSEIFSEEDYIRNYRDFIDYKRGWSSGKQ
jgi:hypothetical protein